MCVVLHVPGRNGQLVDNIHFGVCCSFLERAKDNMFVYRSCLKPRAGYQRYTIAKIVSYGIVYNSYKLIPFAIYIHT